MPRPLDTKLVNLEHAAAEARFGQPGDERGHCAPALPQGAEIGAWQMTITKEQRAEWRRQTDADPRIDLLIDALDEAEAERDALKEALDDMAQSRGKGANYSGRLLDSMAKAYGSSSASDIMRAERDAARAEVERLTVEGDRLAVFGNKAESESAALREELTEAQGARETCLRLAERCDTENVALREQLADLVGALEDLYGNATVDFIDASVGGHLALTRASAALARARKVQDV